MFARQAEIGHAVGRISHTRFILGFLPPRRLQPHGPFGRRLRRRSLFLHAPFGRQFIPIDKINAAARLRHGRHGISRFSPGRPGLSRHAAEMQRQSGLHQTGQYSRIVRAPHRLFFGGLPQRRFLFGRFARLLDGLFGPGDAGDFVFRIIRGRPRRIRMQTPPILERAFQTFRPNALAVILRLRTLHGQIAQRQIQQSLGLQGL